MPLVTAEYSSRIPTEGHGIFLLEYLSNRFSYRSLESWITLLKAGHLFLEGEVVLEDTLLRSGQKLTYIVENYPEPDVPIDWKFLWEKDDLFAVHKPAGLPISRTGRIVYNTLVQLVQRESEWPDAHLMHRLDRETSGIVLFAKNKDAAKKWQKKLSTVMIKKKYLAVVYGMPSWDHRILECHLGEKQGSLIRSKMFVLSEGKFSKTSFRVLESNNGYSLVECELYTGRKHQIRAQLSFLGYPIVGDKIYAHEGEYYLKRCEGELTTDDLLTLQSSSHMLHAFSLEVKQKEISYLKDKDLPSEWIMFLKKQGISLTKAFVSPGV